MRITDNEIHPAFDPFDRRKHSPRVGLAEPRLRDKRFTTSVVVAAFVFGLFIGLMSSHGSTRTVTVSDPRPAPTVTQTKTVEKQVFVPTLPTECKMVIEVIEQMRPSIDVISNAGQRELDIMDRASVAINSRNVRELATAGTDQNKLNNSISDSRRKLGERMDDLATAMEACNAVLSGASPLRTG